jgi:2,4-dienoyl-CoA reductase-like NADH-dependent reductase (Old Yellow Enzyme family)
MIILNHLVLYSIELAEEGINLMLTNQQNHDSGPEIRLLLEPYLLGDLPLRNRIVMAPLTRTRSTLPGQVPNELMQEYYRQRASLAGTYAR